MMTRTDSRISLAAGIGAILLLAGWSGCAENRASSASAGVPPFAAVAKGRIDIEGGVIRLASSRDGVIERVLVQEGDQVKAGQVLASLDARQQRIGVALAQREREQAEAALPALRIRLAAAARERERITPLVAGDAAARVDLDNARDAEAVLRAELAAATAGVATAAERFALAQYELDQRSIRAPLDGRIIRRDARPGAGVSTLNVTPLFLFAPDAPLVVRTELDEQFFGKVEVGQEVQVSLEVDESRRFRGKVLRIGQVLGAKAASDDPGEKADVRVAECVTSIDAGHLPIGQRVIVGFLNPAP